MTPFQIQFQPGQPIVDQVVFAATRAFVSGQIRPGDAFPSVRALAADLRIHPNTAHKAVQALIRDGWLEVHPGIGTIVADRAVPGKDGRQRLLDDKVDPLVVDARSTGLSLEELQNAIAERWAALDKTEVGR
ncbi:GntR family transcriptional regulator [Niveispirillum sp. KHB5.9]|uniref:GntR family transcriptional regulator n=1 Tax=Niveispirillum sp. KHB5.9 TaxID=3400269 RepID=UPI003A84FAF9